jgi:hypothetical protein
VFVIGIERVMVEEGVRVEEESEGVPYENVV